MSNDTIATDDIIKIEMPNYSTVDSSTIITGLDTMNSTSSYGDYSIGPIGSIDTITINSIDSNYSFNTISNNYNPWTPSSVNITNNGIEMPENSDIKIGGRSLIETLDQIQERLAILKPDPELESRWEQLKNLKQQYDELLKDIVEKERIMKILKET
jgi:hypothetical protein